MYEVLDVSPDALATFTKRTHAEETQRGPETCLMLRAALAASRSCMLVSEVIHARLAAGLVVPAFRSYDISPRPS